MNDTLIDSASNFVTVTKAAGFLFFMSSVLLIVTGIVGALFCHALRTLGVSLRLGGFLAVSSGMLLITVVSWYSHRFTGSSGAGFTALAFVATSLLAAIITLRLDSIPKHIKRIISYLRKNAVTIIFMVISLAFFSVYCSAWLRQDDLLLVTADNNDIFNYVKLTNVLSLGPVAGNNIAGVNLSEWLRSDVFGVFAYISFTSFISGHDVLAVTPVVMIAMAACTALVAFVVCHRLLGIPAYIACPLAFLVPSATFFSYLVFQFFLSQVAFIFIFWGLVAVAIWDVGSQDVVTPCAVSPEFTVTAVVATGVILFFYQALYLFSLVALAGVLTLVFLMRRQSLALRPILRFSRGLGLTFGIIVLTHFLVAGDRLVHVFKQTLFFARKDSAGWPLGFVSPGALFGLPTLWTEDRSSTNFDVILSVAVFFALLTVSVALVLNERRRGTKQSRLSAVIVVLLTVVTCFYVVIWSVYGASYQQWKFASSFPLAFGYVFFGGAVVVTLEAFDRSWRHRVGAVWASIVTMLVATNLWESTSRLYPRIKHFSSDVRRLTDVDELSSATSVTIGVNSFSERMLVASLIYRKSITFAGPVYYTAGKVDDFLGTSGSLLIQNRGPCRSSGVVAETRNFVVRRSAEVPSLTDSTFPFSVDLGPCVGLKGFHGIERWGRWIDGTDGRISFRCTCEPSKRYEVRLRLMPFLVASMVVSQTLEVKVNKHTVGTWVITKPEGNEVSFMIPANIEPGGAVVLELLVPTALSPRSIGGIDPRVFGIGIKEFRLQQKAT